MVSCIWIIHILHAANTNAHKNPRSILCTSAETQPLNGTIIDDVFFNNFFDIVELNIHVKNAVRINRNRLSEVADIEATTFLRANTHGQFSFFELTAEFINNAHAVCFTTAATRSAGRTFVGADENMFIEDGVRHIGKNKTDD